MSDEYRLSFPHESRVESVDKVFDRAITNCLKVKESTDSVWFKDEGLPSGWFYDVRLIKKPYGFMLVVAGRSKFLYETLLKVLDGIDCQLTDDFDDPITLEEIFHM